MRIHILTVLDPEARSLRCTTPTGELIVVWRGADLPTSGENDDVELDAVGTLAWGTEVTAVTHSSPHDDRTVEGVVEQCDGSAVVLRVGTAVVLLEVTGEPPALVVGSTVAVTPAAWEAWPTGL